MSIRSTICIACEQVNPESINRCGACGEPLLVRDRYRAVRLLGHEGPVSLFEVADKDTGELLLLHLFDDSKAEHFRQSDRFEAGGRLLKRLDHPGLFKFHDDFRSLIGGSWRRGLLVGWVEGESLARRILRGDTLSEKETFMLLTALLDTLDYLHSRFPPIIHGNINPSSVFLDTHGSPLLRDFDTSLDTPLTIGPGESSTPRAKGYIPGEQQAGKAQPGSDLYALGMTLIAGLTGKSPHELTYSGDRVDLAALGPLSDRLLSILRKLTEPLPEDRFESVADVRRALEGMPPGTTAVPSGDLALPLSPVGSVRAKEETSLPDISIRIEESTRPRDLSVRAKPPALPEDESPVARRSERPAAALIPKERATRPGDLAGSLEDPLPSARGQLVTGRVVRRRARAARPVELVEVRPRSGRGRRIAVVLFAGLSVIIGILVVFLIGQVGGDLQDHDAPEVRASIEGSTAGSWFPSIEELRAVTAVWADVVEDFSSQYDSDNWSAEQVLGPPDVYPSHGDEIHAWATRHPDEGVEWVEVSYPELLETETIVIVETYNPGALLRVDDLTDSGQPVALWLNKQAPKVVTSSRILLVNLPTPRPIARLRVVLDTTRASGWNEIDAIGLIPASTDAETSPH